MGWFPARSPDGKVIPGCLHFPQPDKAGGANVIQAMQWTMARGGNSGMVGRKRRPASIDARALVAQAKAAGWLNGKRLPKTTRK